VLPDIDYPSVFDPAQIGESALDNALSWDQISPARFNRYQDYNTILPGLMARHQQRAANDPDYRYLEDQVEMAREARKVSALPLQESGRLAMRDEQEAKALAIENRRRSAKGLATLESLASATDDAEDAMTPSEQTTTTPEPSSESPEDTREEANADVLLLETGRILVDSVAMRPDTSIALRAQNQGNKGL
ncbi:carboxy terminal-processing peptidase, partial [Luminiphilus sp.]|nr:carboxy terminal-processing peptidase [Luminiphilus sp.]